MSSAADGGVLGQHPREGDPTLLTPGQRGIESPGQVKHLGHLHGALDHRVVGLGGRPPPGDVRVPPHERHLPRGERETQVRMLAEHGPQTGQGGGLHAAHGAPAERRLTIRGR